jgi:hypothetical protein
MNMNHAGSWLPVHCRCALQSHCQQPDRTKGPRRTKAPGAGERPRHPCQPATQETQLYSLEALVRCNFSHKPPGTTTLAHQPHPHAQRSKGGRGGGGRLQGWPLPAAVATLCSCGSQRSCGPLIQTKPSKAAHRPARLGAVHRPPAPACLLLLLCHNPRHGPALRPPSCAAACLAPLPGDQAHRACAPPRTRRLRSPALPPAAARGATAPPAGHTHTRCWCRRAP